MSRRLSTLLFVLFVIVLFFLLSKQLDFSGLYQRVLTGDFLTVQFIYTSIFTSFVIIGVFVVFYIIRKM